MNIESRPWTLQDLLDNLQKMIVEEPDDYCNERRWTLCTARDYLKQYFMQPDEPLVMEDLTIVGESVDRLAAYEDTGLDPEEIEQLKRERDAAIEDCSGYCNSCQFEKGCAKHDMNDAAPTRWYYGDCEDWEWRGVQKEEQ